MSDGFRLCAKYLHRVLPIVVLASPFTRVALAQETRPATSAVGPSETARGHRVKLQELEEGVVDLKEKVFKIKSRVALLTEELLHSTIAESRAVIIHRNEMGGAFRLEQAAYFLDENRIYYQDDKTGILSQKKEIEIYNNTIGSGHHIVRVELRYRGHGVVFTYLKGYRFTVASRFPVHAAHGKITVVKIIGYDKGGPLEDFEKRPSVKYVVNAVPFTKQNLARYGGKRPEPEKVPRSKASK